MNEYLVRKVTWFRGRASFGILLGQISRESAMIRLSCRWVWLVGLAFSFIPVIAAAGDWQPVGLEGVSLETLAVDPSDPQRILAGPGPESGSGVWKSEDGGETWTHITAGLPDQHRVNTIAFQPSEVGGEGEAPETSGAGVVLMGTLNFTIGGPGLYRSTDLGDTWQPAISGLERPVYEVTSIVFDSANPNLAYAGHNDPTGGVSKSEDGGLTWSDISNGLGPDDFCRQGCTLGLALDPSSPQTIYAAMPALADLYKTTSGGDTWFPTHLGFWPERIAQASAQPATLYVTGSTFDLGGGVARTFDGGDSWENLSHQPGLPPLALASHRSIALSPEDPNIVWLLVESFTAESTDEALYRSMDGGLEWTRAHEGLEGVEKVYRLVFQGTTLLAATNNGVYRREESGMTLGFESCQEYRWLGVEGP